MASINKVILIGNLGQKPELKTLDGGNAVCNLSVATSRKFKNKAGEVVEETEWSRVVCWGKTAENVARYLDKGRPVYVEGRLQTRKYEKDGQTHYSTDIVAETVQFLGGGKGDGAGASSSSSNYATEEVGGSDGLPF